MSIIGIVCEYNPFHNGHLYHIKQSRMQLGEDSTIVCVMSGDFVQRGEAAVYSKYARAEAACRCGGDLVIELPLPWALSSAERFATGAVGLLDGMGAEYLSFGSEAGDIKPLDWIAQCILEPDFQQSIKELLHMEATLSYAAARQRVLEERLGATAKLIAQPNNILAVEYIKAIYDQRFNIKPFTVKRFGSEHDRAGGTRGTRSAEELRRMLAQEADISADIPAAAFQVFERERQQGRTRKNGEALETAIMSRLRMFDESYYADLPDAGDGAGQRLYKAAREEATLDAVVAAARTKRYPVARMRRMAMCAALGLKKTMSDGLPEYARVLAANDRGCQYLRTIDTMSTIQIVTKPASVNQLGENIRSVFSTGALAHDLFTLGYMAKEERKGGNDWRIGPKII